MTKLEELQAQMKEAVAVFQQNGDMTKIQEVSNAMNKHKAEIAKTEAEKLQKESEALAGKREALEVAIFNHLNKGEVIPDLANSLRAVKSWGFTYRLNRTDESTTPPTKIVETKVNLLTQTVKARKGTGGGGGKSKDEYGISLQEIVDKFGTTEEQAAIDKAVSNSASWQLKQAVKKRAIAEGKLAPVK